LFCDRLGVWPLFYYADGDSVLVSPHPEEILAAHGEDLGPCVAGMVSLLLFGHHLSEETVLHGMRRCNGGETIVVNGQGEIEERIVWRPRHVFQERSTTSPKELSDQFVAGVRRILPDGGDVVIPLSGGYDSRCVLGAVLECVDASRIQVVTFGGPDTYDYRISRLIARKIGARNEVFSISEDYYNTEWLRKRGLESGYTYSAYAGPPKEFMNYLLHAASRDVPTFFGAGGDAITGSHLHSGDDGLRRCESWDDFAELLIQTRAYNPTATVCRLLGLDEKDVAGIVARGLDSSVVDGYDKPWQFLDAWDIYVRGRMEVINLLPFDHGHWRCPHLDGGYFRMMSTQCYEEKYQQNIYKRMASSRFRFLFGLPTKRRQGRSLAGSAVGNIIPSVRLQAARASTLIRRLLGVSADGAGRNFAKDEAFFGGAEGRRRLECAMDVLKGRGVWAGESGMSCEAILKNPLLASTLITLGYAFGNSVDAVRV